MSGLGSCLVWGLVWSGILSVLGSGGVPELPASHTVGKVFFVVIVINILSLDCGGDQPGLIHPDVVLDNNI